MSAIGVEVKDAREAYEISTKNGAKGIQFTTIFVVLCLTHSQACSHLWNSLDQMLRAVARSQLQRSTCMETTLKLTQFTTATLSFVSFLSMDSR